MATWQGIEKVIVTRVTCGVAILPQISVVVPYALSQLVRNPMVLHSLIHSCANRPKPRTGSGSRQSNIWGAKEQAASHPNCMAIAQRTICMVTTGAIPSIEARKHLSDRTDEDSIHQEARRSDQERIPRYGGGREVHSEGVTLDLK